MQATSIMFVIFAQILFLVSIVGSTRSIFSEDNEITNQTNHLISMKFPEMDEILLKNGKMPRKRKTSTMVVPVQEICGTQSFQSELNILRKKMRCRPRDTIVDLRSSTHGIMTPNAVVVKRCGGGTCTKPKSCVSLEKKNTTFYVKTIENKTRIVCNSIVVSEDVKCGCACEHRSKKCKPNQVYNQDACGCVCDNIVSTLKMEVDDEVFDSEKLITEIEKRPTLYNKESPQYSNKDYREKLWAEVYQAVVPNWNQLSKNGKTLKGDEIQKKWKNIRDYFRKQVQMNERGKSVQFSRKRRKYIYFDQLLFLLPTMQGRDASANYNLEQGEENDETEDYTISSNVVENEVVHSSEIVTVPNPKPRREKKEEMRPRYEDILLEVIKEKRVDEIDEDRNFLLSLVPSLKKLTDEQKFTVKSEFLNVLKQQFLQSNLQHCNRTPSCQLAQKQSSSFSQQLQLLRHDGLSSSAPPSPTSSCTPDISNNDSNLLSPKSEPDFYDEL